MVAGHKTTIAEVARDARVSPASVSRALHHPELVNAETLDRIHASINALGYKGVGAPVNDFKTNGLIAINVPWLDNPFYADIVRGAREAAGAAGYDVIISCEPSNDESVDHFCSLLQNCGADGLIILSPVTTASLRRIETVAPTVQCCEFDPETDVPYVSIDDCCAAHTAVEHLLSCGCRRMAIVCGPLRYKYARNRLKGFMDVNRTHGLQVPSSRILKIPNNSYELAYSAICHMLDSEERPDGVFACSDTHAAAVVRAATHAGLSVPRDLLVVGFDNTVTATMVTPALTTVSQPRYRMGYSACTLLLERLGDADANVSSMLLETELVVRDSTARLAHERCASH